MALKKVTIRDVATRAGVSYQTVSRVLNGRPDVADATRERIQQVIEALDYRPSAIARSLISRRTFTLGLITADFSDYFFTQVIVGAEAEARRHSYFYMLCSTERNDADEPEYFRLLTERKVDGLLFARPSTEPDNRHIVALLRQEMPVVTIAYHVPGMELSVVDVDNESGGFEATQCLLESGHQQIALITGPTGWKSVTDREAGYRRALRQAGVSVDEALIEAGDWSHESGYQAMCRLLERAPHFTAAFAHNDTMAIGALRALREAGRRVPEDVSVVGYDDIPTAAYAFPRLSTIRQPMREVGQVGTRLLIEAIADPHHPKRQVLLKPELVRRESCAIRR